MKRKGRRPLRSAAGERSPRAAGRITAVRAAKSDVRALLGAARNARDFAFAPFSRFKVGAAIRSTDGRVFTGCNIENASFSLTCCAERVAIYKALSDGVRDFDQIAIVTDAASLTPPCGACRQVLWEFAPDCVVVLANVRGRTKRVRLAALLPSPFDSSDLV